MNNILLQLFFHVLGPLFHLLGGLRSLRIPNLEISGPEAESKEEPEPPPPADDFSDLPGIVGLA